MPKNNISNRLGRHVEIEQPKNVKETKFKKDGITAQHSDPASVIKWSNKKCNNDIDVQWE
jgi:hypothetical protein